MKTLFAIVFGLSFNFLGLPVNTPDVPTFSTEQTEEEAKDCTLSITGYGNFGELGRVKVTISTTASTCEKAAEELKEEIIKREVSIEK